MKMKNDDLRKSPWHKISSNGIFLSALVLLALVISSSLHAHSIRKPENFCQRIEAPLTSAEAQVRIAYALRCSHNKDLKNAIQFAQIASNTNRGGYFQYPLYAKVAPSVGSLPNPRPYENPAHWTAPHTPDRLNEPCDQVPAGYQIVTFCSP